MTKKDELKSLVKQIADAATNSVNSMQRGDINSYDYYNSQIENLSGKFDVLAGSKSDSIEQVIDSRASYYGCSDANMKDYGDSQNFAKIHYCIGVLSQIELDAIDTMF